MNFGRLALAAVVATVADMVYGFVVYAQLLGTSFNAFPGVFRPADDTSYMGYLALGVLIVMFCASFIYARGYEGGAPISEGVRFGCVLGTFMVGVALINYAILNVGRMLTLKMAVAGFVEWLIMGTVIALVARPQVGARRMATV
jgi:hypothetical protein